MALFDRQLDVDLDTPVLVVALEGWIDAGFTAAAATASMLTQLDMQVVGEFDTDALLDHRARRPLLRIEEGVHQGLIWPSLTLRAGTDALGNDILLLSGPEPDHQWRSFLASVLGVALDYGARMMVGLGAFPAPAPHTRPVRLAATAPSPELAAQLGYERGTVEVPAGAEAALEEAFTAAGVTAMGLWARVPHYVAAMPFPAAAVALLGGLNRVAGLALDTADLDTAAEASRVRIDDLVAQNPEHVALVRQLEAQFDAEASEPVSFTDLPSGDELAAELERFLRNHGGDQPG